MPVYYSHARTTSKRDRERWKKEKVITSVPDHFFKKKEYSLWKKIQKKYFKIFSIHSECFLLMKTKFFHLRKYFSHIYWCLSELFPSSGQLSPTSHFIYWLVGQAVARQGKEFTLKTNGKKVTDMFKGSVCFI